MDYKSAISLKMKGKEDTKMGLGKFLTVFGLGALAGLVLAPKKGSELVEDLKDTSKKAYDSVKDMTKEDVMNLVDSTVENVKKSVNEFDKETFKETTKLKYDALKVKLDELVKVVQENEQVGMMMDTLAKTSKDVSEKFNQVKEKIVNNGEEVTEAVVEAVEEELDEMAEEVQDLIDELKDEEK